MTRVLPGMKKGTQRVLIVVGAILLGILVLRRVARRGAWCKEGLDGCNKKACNKCLKTKSASKCKSKCSGCNNKGKKSKKGKKGNNKGYTKVYTKGANSGGGGGGGMCTVTHYTADPDENHGWDETHSGMKLTKALGMKTVAVPLEVYEEYKDKTVTIEGKTYTVRDSCKDGCRQNRSHFDILVKDKATADRLGIRKVPCSWKPAVGW